MCGRKGATHICMTATASYICVWGLHTFVLRVQRIHTFVWELQIDTHFVSRLQGYTLLFGDYRELPTFVGWIHGDKHVLCGDYTVLYGATHFGDYSELLTFVRWLHGDKHVCVEATQFCMGLHASIGGYSDLQTIYGSYTRT